MSCGCRKCFLESPLVVLFYIIFLATLTCLLVYAVLAANFGAWSYVENTTYYFTLCSNGLCVSCIIWIIYFFNKHDRFYYKQRRLIASNVVLTIAFLICIGSIYCFTYEPTKAEIRNFLRERYHQYGKVRSIFGELETERKCCGINGYTDYIFENNQDHDMHDGFLFPESCCKKSKDCQDKVHPQNFKVLWQKGCIKQKVSELESSNIYRKFSLIKFCAMIPLVFPILTIISMQIIVCHTKRKRKKGDDEKLVDRVHSWEDPNQRREVTVVFQAPRAPGEGPSGDANDVRGQTSSLDSIAAYQNQISPNNPSDMDHQKKLETTPPAQQPNNDSES